MFCPISIPLDLVQIGALTTLLIHAFRIRLGHRVFPGIQYVTIATHIALLFVLDWGLAYMGLGSIFVSWSFTQVPFYEQEDLSQLFVATMLCLQFAALGATVRAYSCFGFDRFFVLRFLLLSCSAVYCIGDLWALAALYLWDFFLSVVANILGRDVYQRKSQLKG